MAKINLEKTSNIWFWLVFFTCISTIFGLWINYLNSATDNSVKPIVSHSRDTVVVHDTIIVTDTVETLIAKQFPNAPLDFECVYQIDGKCYDDQYDGCDLLDENAKCLLRHNRIGNNQCCIEMDGVCYYCKDHLSKYINQAKKPSNTSVKATLGDSVVVLTAKWCSYCTKLKNELKTANMAFTEVDADADKAIAKRFKVKGYPTILIYSNGKISQRFDGYTSIAKIKASLH